ncbi:organic radical activating enzyme [Peptoclostridium acidaminophilum DSM 3953]|uniref:7-carboxy-7-deazaguanine synthase n=1 Tax=Peptoclostridium acidaminophilum DSM 3953 TaxID=1286171 RepID=W8U4V2_PEPAC|nr:putative 7-carboxy-7-deazaguanine synthase QueE [Peptoclostridium acidaminophilum]AHM55981.1 organic radical activating enzyme [Peptoclostridium acidaminophilum DSM 3953]
MEYNVVEKFASINGEGAKTGQLAVFIRFAGCNLSCSYCDTKWANEADVKAEKMSAQDIHEYIQSTGISNVTLTGGEPLNQYGIMELLQRLAEDSSIDVEIETNGSIDIEPFLNISPRRPSFTLDYKLGSSGMESYMDIENLTCVSKRDAVKFVVGSFDDIDRAKDVIEEYELDKKTRVYFSPVFGEIDPVEIVEYMKSHYMNGVSLQLQLHKFIWDSDKRGV